MSQLESAYQQWLEIKPAHHKVMQAVKTGNLNYNYDWSLMYITALQAGVIDAVDADRLQQGWQARLLSIQVDEFAFDDLARTLDETNDE